MEDFILMLLFRVLQNYVLTFDNTVNGDKEVERNDHIKYFLPRVNITNYNVLIDSRNLYDQPINDKIKKY